VLKRILRRGVRYGKQFLHLPDGFFARLVSTVCNMYSNAFPELKANGNEKYVTDSVAAEETAFLANWVQGEQQFGKIVKRLKDEGKTVIPGEDAAFLYQSGGFPVDLTRIMAEDAGMTVDEEGFMKAQAAHVEASKGESKVGDGSKVIVLETAHMAILQKQKNVGGTDDSIKYNLGTEGKPVASKIMAIFDGTNFLEEAAEGTSVGVILDVTPFYAEQGGQVSDVGTIGTTSTKVEIFDCRKYGEYTLHQGVVRTGSLKVGDAVEANVDMSVRNQILPNHTLTHVLNLGLRAVLPQDQVDQKGSLCDTKKLRFDFNCRQAVSSEQLRQVEKVVRDQIDQKLNVYCKVVPLASAKEITTLRAVFGETYPDPVRVVSVGKSVEDLLADPTNPEWMQYSVELCGGTHMTNTSDAQAFVVAEEGGIAKGIRRVTCLTGALATKAIEDGEAFRVRIEAAFKLKPAEMMTEQKAMQTSLSDLVCSCYLKEGFMAELKKMHKLGSKASAGASNDLCKSKADEAKSSG
jgi:alanyl-tRNA synthetase